MSTRAAASADGANQPVPLEGARHELRQILESPAFADSPRLRALLSFLVEETFCGRAAELKESVVAVEVFGRPADFDHRTDSVVRVQIHNLRSKLHAYYEGEGREHPIHITLPAGSYIPAFQALPSFQPQESAANVGHSKSVLWKYLAAATLLTVCGAAWWFRSEFVPPWSSGARSIAVLPFLNLSDTDNGEYFTDGIAEDLTTELARVPAMRVSARTSAFQFRGSGDVRKIRQQLGVRTLLEGSVRREGNRVHITAQLINAENGYHLWSNSYDRDVAGIQEMEGDIVHSVVDVFGRAGLTEAAHGTFRRRTHAMPTGAGVM